MLIRILIILSLLLGTGILYTYDTSDDSPTEILFKLDMEIEKESELDFKVEVNAGVASVFTDSIKSISKHDYKTEREPISNYLNSSKPPPDFS